MELNTGLAFLGAAVGSAKLIEKILGPSADYLGEGLKDWTTKACANVSRIFQIAGRILGVKLNTPGTVAPRVLKEILKEGQFCEDPISAEYFGGVLASSRSGISRDDRGARILSIISRLSTYQIRGHCVFYRILKSLFNGSGHVVTDETGRIALQFYIPAQAFALAMDFTMQENALNIIAHTVVGLASESLLGDRYAVGSRDYLIKSGFNDAPDELGIIVQPSTLGTELFLWAHGLGDINAGYILKKELAVSSDIKISIGSGVRGIMPEGPKLENNVI